MPELLQSLAISLQHCCSVSVMASGMKHASCGAITHSIVKPIASVLNDRDMRKVYTKSLSPQILSAFYKRPGDIGTGPTLPVSSWSALRVGARIPEYRFRLQRRTLENFFSRRCTTAKNRAKEQQHTREHKTGANNPCKCHPNAMYRGNPIMHKRPPNFASCIQDSSPFSAHHLPEIV